ncbi:MAG: peptidase S8 and S53 subtilisin kexin sedolisin, partial [Cyanobacteria bacterium J083]
MVVKKSIILALSLVSLGILIPAAKSLDSAISENGIDALRLHQPPYKLTGKKIAIAQLEIGRPGQFGYDKKARWNPQINIAGVFFRDRRAKANERVDNHAAQVAMVMLSTDKKLRGVAPDAKLYAGAVGSLKEAGQPEECLSAQHLAQQNSGDVRAINFSFGESLSRDPRDNAKLDGNALLTQCIDWSARVHNTLYVVAGNQGKGGIPIPTDNFNGITTAYTAKRKDKFVKVDFANLSSLPVGVGRRLIKREINFGARRAISLVAPGDDLYLRDVNGEIAKVTGTSFAAPLITGTVALLQQYGDARLRQHQKSKYHNWSIAARQHEVTKAILLNSANKIQDPGDGTFLGMSLTVLDKHNRNWLKSDAYRKPEIPLDIEMGTGQLNAFRAYQQFSAGQWQPHQSVNYRGWDYNQVKVNKYQEYKLKQPLKPGTFVSITLTWDRLVELKDNNQNQSYDIGETFINRGLNNLDLFLLPASSNNLEDSVCRSISQVDSVEHIFCPI